MPGPGFELLYEHGPCLVVVKPNGVPTQAPPGIESLETRIRAFLAARDGAPAGEYLGIPHRLDRASSGVMVFATRRSAARKLAKQFERRTVRKIYWAAVQTHLPPSGAWHDILRKVHGQPRAQVVASGTPGGQEATLRFRVIGRHALGSILEIELETGRTHQIRIQAASRGYALIGDAHYGSLAPFGAPTDDERLRPIALHARSLAFDDPTTKERITCVSPPPSIWAALEMRFDCEDSSASDALWSEKPG